jgi:thiamine transporter ThiT
MDWNAVGASAGEGIVAAAVAVAILLLVFRVPWPDALLVGLFTGLALLVLGLLRARRQRRLV